jgi:FkbM family methyltransferase
VSFVQKIRRLIPQSAKNYLRQRTMPWRIANLLSPALPPSICVDVGASHYPHVNWLVMLNAPETRWLAVEPNQENLYYVKNWAWKSTVTTCTTGLSRDGGPQTLHITNVDTGSSLLPPEIPESMKHRVTNLSYFFPVTERRIDTLTLAQAIEGLPADAPVFVKADTQGTELSILEGAEALFAARRIVGVELEATLLAQPVMKGSGKFWEVCRFMESQGFELLHVKLVQATGPNGVAGRRQRRYLNECDAVFALRVDVAASLPVDYRAALLAFYASYALYDEALALLGRDTELTALLRARGADVDALINTLKASPA